MQLQICIICSNKKGKSFFQQKDKLHFINNVPTVRNVVVMKSFKKKTKQFVCISCADTIETKTKIKQNKVPPSQHNISSITAPIPEEISTEQPFSEQSPPSVESSSNESQVPSQINSDKLEQRQTPKQFPKFWLDLNVGWDDTSTEKIEQGIIISDL